MKINKVDLAKIADIIVNKNLLVTEVLDILEGLPKVIDETTEIELVVDYQNTLRKVIECSPVERSRRLTFDSKNYPTNKEMIGREIKIFSKLFYFNEGFTKEYAEKIMDDNGFRQANIRELLSLSRLDVRPRLKLKDKASVNIMALGCFENEGFPIIRYYCYYRSQSRPTKELIKSVTPEDLLLKAVFDTEIKKQNSFNFSGYVLGIKK